MKYKNNQICWGVISFLFKLFSLLDFLLECGILRCCSSACVQFFVLSLYRPKLYCLEINIFSVIQFFCVINDIVKILN